MDREDVRRLLSMSRGDWQPWAVWQNWMDWQGLFGAVMFLVL